VTYQKTQKFSYCGNSKEERKEGLGNFSIIITVLLVRKGAGFLCLIYNLHLCTASLEYAMYYRMVTGECGICQYFGLMISNDVKFTRE
jgi:hypothetical protein